MNHVKGSLKASKWGLSSQTTNSPYRQNSLLSSLLAGNFERREGFERTAPTASHPRMVLSVERRSAKWRGVGPFQVSTDTTSAQTEPGIGLLGANSENFLWVSGW